MNSRTEEKLKDISGMSKAVNELLHQAWERGYKYGYKKAEEDLKKDTEYGECEYENGKLLKRMSGGYITYKVEYLLDNLAREVGLLESYRKWKESKGVTRE